MDGRSFLFRSRMTKRDWELLQQAIQEDNPDLRLNSWIISNTTKFCKSFALPLLRKEDPKSPKIERTIWIPERLFEETNNIDVLEKFAEYKGKNPTQIIQRYILDPRIREEEFKRFCKP